MYRIFGELVGYYFNIGQRVKATRRSSSQLKVKYADLNKKEIPALEFSRQKVYYSEEAVDL